MPAGAAELAASLTRWVDDARVLAAIAAMPRDRFMPPALRGRAWENVALPIDCEQTISQPLVVARMLELLELTGSERVLDVGTGSGYHAALLARLAAQVYSIERHPELTELAREALADLQITNIELFVGDGCEGLPKRGTVRRDQCRGRGRRPRTAGAGRSARARWPAGRTASARTIATRRSAAGRAPPRGGRRQTGGTRAGQVRAARQRSELTSTGVCVSPPRRSRITASAVGLESIRTNRRPS